MSMIEIEQVRDLTHEEWAKTAHICAQILLLSASRGYALASPDGTVGSVPEFGFDTIRFAAPGLTPLAMALLSLHRCGRATQTVDMVLSPEFAAVVCAVVCAMASLVAEDTHAFDATPGTLPWTQGRDLARDALGDVGGIAIQYPAGIIPE